MIPLRHNMKQALIGVDQLLNAVLCMIFEPKQKTWADETISAHSWRWESNGVRSWPRKLIDGIFFWEKNHCKESYESERQRLQLPPELRS